MNIAFIAQDGMDSFLGDLERGLAAAGHQIRSLDRFETQPVQELMNWTDVCWLEWCGPWAVQISRYAWKCRVICRLHAVEAWYDEPLRMNWANVDDLIFVAPHIRDILLGRMPGLAQQTNLHTVPIGVDLERFSYKERTHGPNLAFVGNINYKKGPMLLMHCFEQLHKKDQRYRLHLAGNIQQKRYEFYLHHIISRLGLADAVEFHGWVDDVESFLDDKQYLVVTSPLESGPMCVREAMARGIMPVIHNFFGAEQLYPAEYLFNSIDDFVERITGAPYDSKAYRDFVARNYAYEDYLQNILGILNRYTQT